MDLPNVDQMDPSLWNLNQTNGAITQYNVIS